MRGTVGKAACARQSYLRLALTFSNTPGTPVCILNPDRPICHGSPRGLGSPVMTQAFSHYL